MPKQIDSELRGVIEQTARMPRYRNVSAAEMHRRIKKEIKTRFPSEPVPSVRTVQDIIRAARASEPGETEIVVSWPDSFGSLADLPHEASPSYFELLRLLEGRYPLLPLARWFWQISRLAPTLRADSRYLLASSLVIEENRPHALSWNTKFPNKREIEGFLMMEPWLNSNESNTALKSFGVLDRAQNAFYLLLISRDIRALKLVHGVIPLEDETAESYRRKVDHWLGGQFAKARGYMLPRYLEATEGLRAGAQEPVDYKALAASLKSYGRYTASVDEIERALRDEDEVSTPSPNGP